MITQKPAVDTPENAAIRLRLTMESVRASGEKIHQEMLNRSIERKKNEQIKKQKQSQETVKETY